MNNADNVVIRTKGVLVPCGRAGFYEKMGFEKLPVKALLERIEVKGGAPGRGGKRGA